MNMYNTKTMVGRAVLILSCDKYADLWKPFFTQFRKYWPKCTYPVYLGSNTISYTGNDHVKTVLSGKDHDWSSSFISILNKIPEEYLFIWLDDAFITSPVDNKVMEQCFLLLEKKEASHILDHPVAPPDTIAGRKFFGKYEKGTPYRVTTVGFWNKRSLLKLLLAGENPWQFEIFGSYRSSYSDGFYYPRKQIIKYIHVIEKGKLFQQAVSYCKTNNIPLVTDKREIMDTNKRVMSMLQDIYFNRIVKSIPWKFRVSLMWIFRRILISY